MAGKVLMGQKDDHIGQEDEDPSRTLDADKPLYELGSRIGRYKLLSVLGEGGFGMVYSAEQEHPIKRLVALKLVKPGMDTKQVIARFETERQALALLDHPNIAQVFDAGATGAGRPYFAMEYVKGIPITEYCDRYKLGTQERLRLFIPVCQAIQHAHQKGIIHRDIKPSNVLVMLHDEKPIPKIIDFGVAKALNQRLTEKTLFTEKGEFIGTPEYMSPEQAELTGLDVDTRTDIYSLGVLLYELLTGCTPFDPEDLRSKGYGEMQRIIREQDPVKPSTKLTTLGGKLEDIAKRRSATADQLRKSVRGDLDWIVMKALEKDRARRYATAQGLAEDVERHLYHRPVLAGSPGVLYCAMKLVRRHCTQVVVGGLLLAVVILSLVILGLYGGNWLARWSLSIAQGYYDSGRYDRARERLNKLVYSDYVGPQARLLRACMEMDQPGRRISQDELEGFRKESGNVGSQACLLLAKMSLESTARDDGEARKREQDANEYQQEAKNKLASRRRSWASLNLNLALLSDTPAELRDSLTKALQENPRHVESLRIRALASDVSGDYNQMQRDANEMTKVAKDNPEGYALLAIALREQAQQNRQKDLLNAAIKDHNEALDLAHKEFLSAAIEDDKKAIDLARTECRFHDQRRETYMRMSEHEKDPAARNKWIEKALADARKCIELFDRRKGKHESVLADEKENIELAREGGMYHFRAFCALTALGRYSEAQNEYGEFLDRSKGMAPHFWIWATQYARDVVVRKSIWHGEDPVPNETAFAFLRQAIEDHQSLAKKAECVAPKGLVACWSPDGRRLAYSRGPQGYTVIEVNEPNGTKRLLSYNGFDPAWSPNGRWIAFVRDRRTICLQDLAEGRKTYVPKHPECDVWIVDADGRGKPRRLAKGCYPSWSGDSKRLYYYSPEEGGYLCSISIEGDNPRPTRMIQTTSPFTLVSPNEKNAVRHNENVAELVELPGGKVVEMWAGFYPTWSPDGQSLVFSHFDGRPDGVWVCDVAKGTAARIVEGWDWMCFQCAWAPKTGRIALSPALLVKQDEGYFHSGMWSGIWIHPLDPNILGPGSSARAREWPRDFPTP
jgi:serine/threonine protein kinase